MKKNNKKASSIVEVLVILVVVSMWILSAFKIFSSWQKLASNTKNKIIALDIARSGIESVTNIRNTNWFLYSSDYDSCWNTINYNENCIWDNHSNSNSNYYINSGSYIVYSSGSKWYLSWITISWNYDYKNPNYRNAFEIKKDILWFYTQSWSWDKIKPLFTREILISYSGTTSWSETFSWSEMIIKSRIFWKDNSSNSAHKLEMETTLTPWKKD